MFVSRISGRDVAYDDFSFRGGGRRGRGRENFSRFLCSSFFCGKFLEFRPCFGAYNPHLFNAVFLLESLYRLLCCRAKEAGRKALGINFRILLEKFLKRPNFAIPGASSEGLGDFELFYLHLYFFEFSASRGKLGFQFKDLLLEGLHDVLEFFDKGRGIGGGGGCGLGEGIKDGERNKSSGEKDKKYRAEEPVHNFIFGDVGLHNTRFRT